MVNLADPMFLPKVDADGNFMVSSQVRKWEDGAFTLEVVSPNLCDQTSWYQQAIPATDIVLSRVAPYTYQYTVDDDFVLINPLKINAQGGRVLQANGDFVWNSHYLPALKENGSLLIPDSEILEMDFDTKTFTLSTDRQGTITLTGFKVARNARMIFFTVVPSECTLLDVAYAEIQFSTDVKFTPNGQGIRFEVVSSGPNPFHLMPIDTTELDRTYYNMMGYDPTTGKHLGMRRDFLDWKDFEAISNVGKNVIPAWGDKQVETIEFPMDYPAGFALKRSEGTGIRMFLFDRRGKSGLGPLEGTYGTVTIYCKAGQEK